MSKRDESLDLAIVTMHSLVTAMQESIDSSKSQDQVAIPRIGAEAMVVFFNDMTKFMLEIKDDD